MSSRALFLVLGLAAQLWPVSSQSRLREPRYADPKSTRVTEEQTSALGIRVVHEMAPRIVMNTARLSQATVAGVSDRILQMREARTFRLGTEAPL